MKARFRNGVVGLCVVMMTVLSGCVVTSPVLDWLAPDHKDGAYQNVLIVGCGENAELRRTFETSFVSLLKSEQVNATASLDVIPGTSLPTKKMIGTAVKKGQYDAVLITHLVSARDRDISPDSYAVDNFYSYYDFVYGDNYLPDNTHKVVQVKTCMYDVKNAELIWTMKSESIKPNSKEAVVKAQIRTIVKQLKKEGMLGGI